MKIIKIFGGIKMTTEKEKAKSLANLLSTRTGFGTKVKRTKKGEYAVYFREPFSKFSKTEIWSISHVHSDLLTRWPEFRDIKVEIRLD